MKLDFDEALEKVGGFGFIQRFHFSLLMVIQIFHAAFIVGLAFLGKEPNFTCKGRIARNPCQLEPPCKEFVFSKDFTSIVSEWDLVCDSKREAGYAQSLLMFGFLAGVIALGTVSDRCGRLKTFVWGMIFLVAVQLASAFSQNIYQYSFSRFLVGFFSGGGSLAGHILMLEGLVPGQRALISTVYHCGFASGLAVFSAMAYYFRDWRQLTLITCLPMVFFIFIPLLIPESARWLASNGRIQEAEEQLHFFGKKNGLKVSQSLITLIDKTDDAKGKNSADGMVDLFRTPVLRRRMIVLMITWFSCCLAYYGLTFGASNLGGNMYVNFALSGIIEIPACLLSTVALNWLGRRPTMVGSLFVVGFACLGVMALHKSENGAMFSSQTCLALIGKMAIAVAFNSAYLYSSELLPTVLRNTAMGVCSMSARIGGIIAPALPPFGEKVAYLAFGITALSSALLDLTLPESLNKQLPETIMDIESGLSLTTLHPEKRLGIS
ncbi:solute carrier family 22 member 15-like [Acanthaster planci]|uniref:Solute carrier family 22 member 15-like n=1 Tax=Acanthaster planci TaxID=133434 RepID=A0A8B7YPU7_ACAPL|nr:solute carrier family 22 member 15-like [Acanthaster planci]XP_022095302.1 solute carrier family 22 member 15-like [Acanthaster planci]XP_022095303.1 solute carrier family 22 member 15-like [Acanthaster planci]